MSNHRSKRWLVWGLVGLGLLILILPVLFRDDRTLPPAPGQPPEGETVPEPGGPVLPIDRPPAELPGVSEDLTRLDMECRPYAQATPMPFLTLNEQLTQTDLCQHGAAEYERYLKTEYEALLSATLDFSVEFGQGDAGAACASADFQELMRQLNDVIATEDYVFISPSAEAQTALMAALAAAGFEITSLADVCQPVAD